MMLRFFARNTMRHKIKRTYAIKPKALEGHIDQVSTWYRVLTQSELQQLRIPIDFSFILQKETTT